MSTLRIRFTFNRKSGQAGFVQGGTRGVENFTRVLVREVAIRYADDAFELIKQHMEKQIRADIDRELDHMARLLMTKVIGIAGRNRGPTGTLTPVAPVSDAMGGTQMSYSLKTLVPSWERRSPAYLASRKGEEWFKRSGSVLSALGSSKTWTGAFGPISVSVFKHTTFDDAKTKGIPHPFEGKSDVRIGVATIRVSAMNRITPEMLPVLGGGAMNDYGLNPRGSDLLSMLGDPIAWRLGGNPATVPFRPTIQPFLGYFLTRAMPNAVAKRIEQGFQQSRWRWLDEGSAGRTR